MNQIQLPFAALRAFEQFARSGSVSRAAEALGISTSAVIHQLNSLNIYAGQPLTQRIGRELGLTQAGRHYFEAISPAFSVIRQATAQLNEGLLPRRILISALPLIANTWLIGELEAFRKKHPSVEIQVQYARYRNYSSDNADVSFRYGSGDWPGYTSHWLMRGDAVPVATPEFLSRHPLPGAEADLAAALTQLPLIHDGGPELWERWFAGGGVTSLRPLSGLFCEDGLMTLNATLAGAGVSLARPSVIQRELASGRLCQLSARGVKDSQDYYICTREDLAASLNVARVVSFFLSRAAAGAAPSPALS